jgi:hypothetical protein
VPPLPFLSFVGPGCRRITIAHMATSSCYFARLAHGQCFKANRARYFFTPAAFGIGEGCVHFRHAAFPSLSLLDLDIRHSDRSPIKAVTTLGLVNMMMAFSFPTIFSFARANGGTTAQVFDLANPSCLVDVRCVPSLLPIHSKWLVPSHHVVKQLIAHRMACSITRCDVCTSQTSCDIRTFRSCLLGCRSCALLVCFFLLQEMSFTGQSISISCLRTLPSLIIVLLGPLSFFFPDRCSQRHPSRTFVCSRDRRAEEPLLRWLVERQRKAKAAEAAEGGGGGGDL